MLQRLTEGSWSAWRSLLLWLTLNLPPSISLSPNMPFETSAMSCPWPRHAGELPPRRTQPTKAKVLGSPGTEKVALYEGTVEFVARLRLADGAKAGTVNVTLILSYQACNDRLCQAPAKLEVPLTVMIGK